MVSIFGFGKSRKILSIDGGGIKGLFPASFLARIEEINGRKVADYFDLISGTSTGGIIAIAMGLGLSAGEIVDFYKSYGREIFSKRKLLGGLLQGEKYDSGKLQKALENVFGERLLSESKKRLVIPAYNLANWEAILYRTSHRPNHPDEGSKRKAVDVAMATAAAPTYFKPHYNNGEFIDGCLWANNPINAAAVEAIGTLGWKKNKLRILSLGCTESYPKKEHKSFIPNSDMLSFFTIVQSSGSMRLAKMIAGEKNIYRISPIDHTHRFKPDDYTQAEALIRLGQSEADDKYQSLKELFFTEKADRFIPND